MIYLTQQTTAQKVTAPVFTSGSGAIVFKIWSTVSTLTVTGASFAADTPDYVSGEVTLPSGTPVGEYEWSVTQGGTLIGSGLAVVGDYHPERTQFDNDTTYKQYEG